MTDEKKTEAAPTDLPINITKEQLKDILESLLKRLCLSGSITCSGVKPCDACAAFMQMEVLPQSFRLAGWNATPEQQISMLAAYADAHRAQVDYLEGLFLAQEQQAAAARGLHSQPDHGTQGVPEAAPGDSSEDYRTMLLSLDEKELDAVRQQFASGTLPGFDTLTPADIGVFEEVLGIKKGAPVPAVEQSPLTGERTMTAQDVLPPRDPVVEPEPKASEPSPEPVHPDPAPAVEPAAEATQQE